ncbi:MAG: hypothetical protein AB7E95_08795 [Kiritimatiellales bacterium]
MHLRLLPKLLLPAVVLTTACISIQNLDSADPHILHHHNWWNYYERGRLYLREGNPALAKADFETALGLRPGARYPYAQDRWRARTYGMHMIEGYFPNRELGICFYELDQPEKAVPLLEHSMTMQSSARAKFYLNRTRGKFTASASAPQIALEPVPQQTRRRTLTLKGTVRGENYIPELLINGQPEFIELAKRELIFEKTIPLQEGDNSIQVAAKDLSGHTAQTNLMIHADFTPPQITLQEISGQNVTLTCRDNDELAQLEIGSRVFPMSGKTHTFTEPLPTGTALQLAVVDRAGNRIEWSMDSRAEAPARDSRPPRIQLAEAGKTITLYNDEYLLDIRAEDDTALRTVELNGTPLLAEPGPAFRSLQRIPLAPGTNSLKLAAEDLSGHRAEAQVTVVRRSPEYLDSQYRLAVALPPVSGELPNDTFGLRTALLFGEEITRDPVRFYLLASPEEIESVQNEQDLSSSRLADPRTALKAGRRLDADLVFISRVLSDGSGQTVYTQVMDARSGKELFTEDVYLEDSRRLPRQIAGLTMKLEQRFPLIQARVVQDENDIGIDAGSRRGVQDGTRFLIIQSNGAFEQGRVLFVKDRPAELIASGVESSAAQAIIAPKSAREFINPGDYVFTR